MRRLFARALHLLALLLVAVLLLVRPAWAGEGRCTAYPQPRLGQLYILCDDGTRVVSFWHRTLERWETTVLPPPGQTCTGPLSPQTRAKTHQWEGHCR